MSVKVKEGPRVDAESGRNARSRTAFNDTGEARRILSTSASHQDGTNEAHLEDGGAQVEDERAQHEGDAPCATIDGLGQRPRLAAEVETQVQVVQVQEDVLGDAADGALGHFAEHSVPQLVEEGGAGPRGAVWGEEREEDRREKEMREG